jgi:hypothetical protein
MKEKQDTDDRARRTGNNGLLTLVYADVTSVALVRSPGPPSTKGAEGACPACLEAGAN